MTPSDMKEPAEEVGGSQSKGDVDDEYDESADEEEGQGVGGEEEDGFEPIFRMVVTNDMATTEKLVLRDEPGQPLATFAKDTIYLVIEWSTDNYDYFYNTEPDRRRDHESMDIDESE